MLRVFLLTNNNKTSEVFFQHLSLENEQKTKQTKHSLISGILALITGIFLIQFLWLIYYYLIRNKIDQNRDLVVK
jgi:hypothetical protein